MQGARKIKKTNKQERGVRGRERGSECSVEKSVGPQGLQWSERVWVAVWWEPGAAGEAGGPGQSHIRRLCWPSVKGGSESSMGSTRRVPRITSSWSPYASSRSSSSEKEEAPAPVPGARPAGPPLVL